MQSNNDIIGLYSVVYCYIFVSPTWSTASKFEEEDPQETDIEESIAALEVSH